MILNTPWAPPDVPQYPQGPSEIKKLTIIASLAPPKALPSSPNDPLLALEKGQGVDERDEIDGIHKTDEIDEIHAAGEIDERDEIDASDGIVG